MFHRIERPKRLYDTSLLVCVSSYAACIHHMIKVGQSRMHAPYMAAHLVISLPKLPYIHRVYMVLANPTYDGCGVRISQI